MSPGAGFCPGKCLNTHQLRLPHNHSSAESRIVKFYLAVAVADNGLRSSFIDCEQQIRQPNNRQSRPLPASEKVANKAPYFYKYSTHK